jgi:acyl-CoA thioester hydrolase
LEPQAGQGDAPVRLRRRIRFGDCDPAGILFTPRYAELVFEAIELWLEQVFGHSVEDQLRGRGTPTPVRAYSVEMRRSLRPGNEVDLAVWVESISVRSFTLLVIGSLAGTIVFVGRMSCVTTDESRRQAAELPPRHREILEDYQRRCGALPEGT